MAWLFFCLPFHLAKKKYTQLEWQRVRSGRLLPYLVPAATTEAQSYTGVNKDKFRAQWEGMWGRENHRRAWNDEARKRKAYLISTGRRKALFLMQLSALISSSVEHQLKHIFITQHWCKRILDHLLSHGGVRLEYGTQSGERGFGLGPQDLRLIKQVPGRRL